MRNERIRERQCDDTWAACGFVHVTVIGEQVGIDNGTTGEDLSRVVADDADITNGVHRHGVALDIVGT